MKSALWLLWLLVPGGTVILIARWLYQRRDRGVSVAWRKDHERRLNGVGMDGICWTWPAKGSR